MDYMALYPRRQTCPQIFNVEVTSTIKTLNKCLQTRRQVFSLKIPGQIKFSTRFVYNEFYFTYGVNELFHVHHKPLHKFDFWNLKWNSSAKRKSAIPICSSADWLQGLLHTHRGKLTYRLSLSQFRRYCCNPISRIIVPLKYDFFPIHRTNFVNRLNFVYNPGVS
jgi:hypothetical protein